MSSEACQSTSIHTTAAQQTVISSSSTIIQNTVEQTIQDVIDAFTNLDSDDNEIENNSEEVPK